ncbi:MAG TPA: type II toxin-antitoxin system Phd/YefM family antitoxin [Phycisphaerae bacterium]|nr:type II toxin-antitoxin system Phd/YefM family antitoxin [Phycisphaerae bacterium]
MTILTASQVRAEFSDTINRVAYAGERIVIGKGGKPRAALIPMEDLALLERIENEIDLAKAKKALKEGGRIPLEEVKKRLGL